MRIKLLVVLLLVSATVCVPGDAWAAKSRVSFTSNPSGATVVDANLGELGITPFRLDLKRKTALECTFSKAGFESRTVSQVADSLRVEVRADLRPLPVTSVRLGVKPSNASVSLTTLDGTEIYAGESGRVHTLPGQFWGDDETAKFHFQAWAPGFRPIEEEILLTKHQHHELEFPLTEVSTLLSITSEPEGVRVSSQFLGDLGTTPLESRVSLYDLLRARSRLNAPQGDPGRIVLTFSKSGFQTKAKQIVVDFEQTENPVSTVLEPLGGP